MQISIYFYLFPDRRQIPERLCGCVNMLTDPSGFHHNALLIHISQNAFDIRIHVNPPNAAVHTYRVSSKL